MQIGSLTVRPRNPQANYPIECSGDRLTLRGDVQWLLEGPPSDLAAIGEALAGIGEPLADGLLLLDFGNAVGLFNLPLLGRVEVATAKWNRRHFDEMLTELTEIAAGLPFTATAAAALPYDRSVAQDEDVLYHAFVYLRHILCDLTPREHCLLPALQNVVREPHREFRRTRISVSMDKARRLDPTSLADLGSGRSRLTPAVWGPLSQSMLARTLGGRLPEEVTESRVEVTNDTPENRFVKTFLQGVLGVIDGMRQTIRQRSRTDPFANRVLADCNAMEKALIPVVRHHLWTDVGPMTHLPASSTVLQHRRGYREVFQHFARLRLAARIPIGKELARDLLEAKDIAQLYEIWAYFRMVRSLKRLLGQPSFAGRPVVGPFAVAMPWDIAVRWADGTQVVYNPCFSRSRSSARRSYSVPLRPDIALEVPDGPNKGLHIFDAKFRLDKIDAVMGVEEGDDEPTEDKAVERRGTFKRADLYKMHAYRDAIPRAKSVWILYPGTELRFYSVEGERVTVVSDLPHSPEGVGAIHLLPSGGDSTQLDSVLARLLAFVPAP